MPTEGDLYCGQATQNGLKTKYAARMRVSTGACEVGFWSCGSASTSRVKLADAAAALHMDTYPTLPLDFHVNVNLYPVPDSGFQAEDFPLVAPFLAVVLGR